ncbi:MAG: nucleotidyltransferase domain-containing protein [Candidatus Pacearchaeota archaeon]
MASKQIKEIIKRILEKIKLSKDEEKEIYTKVERFIKKLNEKLKKEGIKADVFLGGSFAKKTLIRKKEYDVDIFLRFDKKTKEEEINKIIERLKEIDNFTGEIVKGSRNYLRFRQESENLIFELVPVIKIKKPQEARNVTDLSYFHVNYIENCIKSELKLSNEIKVAKAFIFASGCYGAESYIKGFSGYAIELLVCYYKSFLNFIKKISESKEKIIIDPAKFYKNKKEILLNLNEAKLSSPIVLIDPTFKERNALAALSNETFKKFQNYCKDFIKNPDEEFFQTKKIDENELRKLAEREKMIFVKIKAVTNKQEGDIAGSKLLKFYNYLIKEFKRYCEIYKNGFEYSGGSYAFYYFILKAMPEITIRGPPLTDKENVEKFRAKHKETFIQYNRIYAKEIVDFNVNKFFSNFQIKNKSVMLDMGITKLSLE